MSPFDRLLLKPLPNGKHWNLAQSFTLCGWTVPQGFITDFASIPRPLWWLLPRWGKYGPAAILHDYLYRTAPVSRFDADNLFADAMDACEVNPITSTVIFLSVRIFGSHAWSRRRLDERNYNA